MASIAFRISSVMVLCFTCFFCADALCMVRLLAYGGLCHIVNRLWALGSVWCGALKIIMFRYLIEGYPRVGSSLSVVVPIPLRFSVIRLHSADMLFVFACELCCLPLVAMSMSSTYLWRSDICMPISWAALNPFCSPSDVTISARTYDSCPPIVRPLFCLYMLSLASKKLLWYMSVFMHFMNISFGIVILSARAVSNSLSIIWIAALRSTLVYMSTWSSVYNWWFSGMVMVLV